MGKHHDHSHDGHHHAPAGGSFNAAFAIAITLTLGYTLIEAGYGFYAHSMSLLADSVHNLGDSLGLILAWIANWLLTFPAKKRYSYGFKRTSIFAALANAFILVSTSVLIGYEAIRKLFNLSTVDENVIIVVGIIGILVNVGSSLLFMRGAKDDINIKGAFLHLMGDALILGGVVVAAIIIHYTNWLWLDPVMGIMIVGIVLWGTWGLLHDSVSLMLDGVPRHIDQSGVRKYLESYDGITAIHDLHIWGLSTREVALTAHAIMPTKTLTDADHKKIGMVLHEQFKINHITIQVESGSADDPCIRSEKC